MFRFISDAANLEQLTPPELKFTLLTPLPVEMKAGAEIDYQLQLFGVLFHWKTGMRAWQPPDLFVEEMMQGPYQSWVHRHSFSDGADGATIMEDDVLYRLPVAPLGELAYPLVKAQLERIFSFREERIRIVLLGEGR